MSAVADSPVLDPAAHATSGPREGEHPLACRVEGDELVVEVRAVVAVESREVGLVAGVDGLRERLEILLRALVVDAERLRLRREGWEEPEA